MFCYVRALAACYFADAIFVNSSLTCVSASAVLFPAGMCPLRACASCWAVATTWDSGEIVGLVIYWCLNCTISLTLVARVFLYTRGNIDGAPLMFRG
jgi:hypothetical protein